MPKPILAPDTVAQIKALHAQGLSDRAIASRLDIVHGTVQRWRVRKGLNANTHEFKPSQTALNALPTHSNREMARVFGMSPETWSRVRKAHGVANFRAPTTIKRRPVSVKAGLPIVRVPKAPKPAYGRSDAFALVTSTLAAVAPRRDYGLLSEAQAFLQRERYNVFNRRKIGIGEGWQVGRDVLDDAAMLAKAERLGFRREAWMGGI